MLIYSIFNTLSNTATMNNFKCKFKFQDGVTFFYLTMETKTRRQIELTIAGLGFQNQKLSCHRSYNFQCQKFLVIILWTQAKRKQLF